MSLENSELGKKSQYISEYDSTLLFPIPRKIKRDEIGVDDNKLPFYGIDIWTHYEVSWLNKNGKPKVAIAVIEVPANSPCIIESKSMKLYFNSFNNYSIASIDELNKIITKDLSVAAGTEVNITILPLDTELLNVSKADGICLDSLDISVSEYIVNPNLLKIDNSKHTTEKIYSNLLKSNCLVTNQPDWATVFIEYTGAQIDHESLLKYIISFRNHNEFHEQCVERIYADISKICNPRELTVYARFTRRGGLDINPIRSSKKLDVYSNLRLIRQ
ncbi:MAG: NADPH-dependent 7-cyano-7-deazaguanine reductase QueF [Burkholderiales bacterium]|nr:NADPH-dependent 7-cyano-7-deazaguanine reductase QueF [Burkholderiales bacterium]